MSARYAFSLRIDGPSRVENRSSSILVWTFLNGMPGEQIDFSTEDFLQFILHFDELEEGGSPLGIERDHHIDIAIRAEIIAKNRSKQFQRAQIPLLAELLQRIKRNRDGQFKIDHAC